MATVGISPSHELNGQSAPSTPAKNIAASRAQAVPVSLPPFWIICAMTLVVAHYQLWGRLNVAYKGLGVTVLVMAVITAGFVRLLSRPQVLCLLAFQLVMIVNMILGRFYDVSELFTTSSPPIILFRCLPLMLCGYTIARFPQQQRAFLLVIATIYWLFCIPDFIGFAAGAREGLDRSMTQVQRQGLEGLVNAREWAQAYLSCFIYFAPLLLFFAITLLRLYPDISRQTLLYLIVIQSTFVATAMLSGFAASILMSIASLVLFGIFAPVRSFGYRLRWIAISVVGLVIVEFVRQSLFTTGYRSAAWLAFDKVTSLLTGLFDRSSGQDLVEQMRYGSSGRANLLWKSIESFFRNPLVGVGFQADSTEIGGHSFFGDAAGTFGLVGFVPIAAFFLLIVLGLARARRRAPTSWPVASSQIFIWALMLGLVINPYLLEMLSLSYFLFLFLGLAIADTETTANQGGPTLALGRSS
jgi:hypothetical protein